VDEVQSQLLPQVHHASVSDELSDESSPVSVLQAARAFGRAHETTIRILLRSSISLMYRMRYISSVAVPKDVFVLVMLETHLDFLRK